jgi:hypothetical protein
MLGLILPGLVVIGAAASPAVAAAMANVFPNKLGDWVEDNVIPKATYPSMERVEEEEGEEEYDEPEFDAPPAQDQGRWERIAQDADVSLSRRRCVTPICLTCACPAPCSWREKERERCRERDEGRKGVRLRENWKD